MKLGCIIMAAGESRRFGKNKLLQEFDGVPLYARAMAAVPEGVFDPVCVVTRYDAVAALAAEKGFTVVWNERPDLGVSHTIRLGLETMLDCCGTLFMTADQPLLTKKTLQNLADAFVREPAHILAAAHAGNRGNPCLFPQALFPSLLSLEGDTGGSRVIKANADKLRLLEVPKEELVDCDTVQTLQALEGKFR